MNKIFKIVWNAARGKMMVVNEATSSVQTGKKAAVTVAVVATLAAGSAMASDLTEVEWTGDKDIVLSTAPEQNANPQGYLYKDNLVKLGEGSYSITGPAHQWGFVQNSSFIGENASLTLDAKLDSNNSAAAIGDRTKDITVDKLTVKSEYYGIYKGYTEPGFESLVSNIKANEVSVNSTKSALYTAIKDVTVSFTEFDTLNLTSKEHALKNNGGTVIIGDGSGDVTFTSTKMGAVATIKDGATTTINAANVTVNATINDHDSEYKNSAVYLNAGSMTLEATNALTVTATKGEGSKNVHGIHVTGADRLLEVEAGTATISATNKSGSAYGILAEKDGSVSAKGNVTITANGADDTAGVRVVNAEVTLGDAEKVVTITSQTTKDYAHGIQVRGESTVDVNGSALNITSTAGEYGYGLTAQGLTTNGQPLIAKINVNSAETTINASGVGVFATGDSEVKLNSATSINVDAPFAIEARNGAHVDVNVGGNADTVLNGDIVFSKAYQECDNTAVVTVNLNTAKSVWNGAAKALWHDGLTATSDDFAGLKLNLTLANGAQWNPTAIEKLGKLEDENQMKFALRSTPAGGQFGININQLNMDGGVINLQDGVQIGVDELEGSGGTVNLGTENGETDAGLNVGQLDDKTKLDVNLMNADLTKELTSDDLTPEQTQELLKNVADGSANVTTDVAEGQYNDGYSANGKDGVVATTKNSIMSNTLDLASSAPLAMNRLLMNDVRKRMGDLRAAEGTHGVWARYDGGKLSGERGLENDFTTVQVGIDTVPVVDAPRFGVAFAYTKSDTDMLRGSADMDAFSLAFYGTKFYDNGMFVDVIGRMATADTDVTVEGQKGTMDNVALSLSGELGWRFDVTDKFYFEPQAELTYTYVNADKLALGNSSYEFDSVDSLMGRVGFAAGFKCPNNYGDVYVRASAVHEFLGDSAVTGGNGTIHEVDGKDTWVEFGIGANFNINKSTYVYADLERTEGAKLEEDWRANVGVRFAF